MSEEVRKSVEQKKVPRGASLSVSRFIVILAGVAAILLLIVNNSVTVDTLIANIASLDSAYSGLTFQNDSLQAELRRLSSAERITRIASERLGMVYSSHTLEQIQIDNEKLQEAEKQDERDSTK